MKPNTLAGFIRRHFIAFAATLKDLSPEGRRSVMVASVISGISLAMIASASMYTWRIGGTTSASFVPLPSPTPLQATSPASSDIEVEGVSRVSALPVAAVQPLNHNATTPALVMPSAAPTAEPATRVQPSPTPRQAVRHHPARRYSHQEPKRPALSDDYIRSYLAKHFPKKTNSTTYNFRTPVRQQPAILAKNTAIPVASAVPQRRTVATTTAFDTQGIGRYAIQVGYYTNRTYAKAYVAQLAQRGLRPYLVATKVNGPVRVYIGRFDSVTDARTAYQQLPSGVNEGMIVKTNW